MTLTAARLDKKCGSSGIPDNAKCSKKTTGSTKKKVVAAAALTAGVVAAGVAVKRSRRGVIPARVKVFKKGMKALPPGATAKALTGKGPAPKLRGSSVKGLLKAAAKPQSKTQRMKANTVSKMKTAESAIGNAARLEIKRMGAVANAMGSAGEASGMQMKLTARNVRLRTEAARRKYEPGYRNGRKNDTEEWADAVGALTAGHFQTGGV